jgi:tellurite methyltransferase
MKNKQLPESVKCYKEMPIWGGEKIPKGLFSKHNTKSGVWGKLSILKGELLYTVCDTGEKTLLKEGQHMIIIPQQYHFITIPENMNPKDVEIQINFYKE